MLHQVRMEQMGWEDSRGSICSRCSLRGNGLIGNVPPDVFPDGWHSTYDALVRTTVNALDQGPSV